MGRLLVFLGAMIGGSLGWWLGALVGVVTAFMVSTVGTGAGIYISRRFIREYLP